MRARFAPVAVLVAAAVAAGCPPPPSLGKVCVNALDCDLDERCDGGFCAPLDDGAEGEGEGEGDSGGEGEGEGGFVELFFLSPSFFADCSSDVDAFAPGVQLDVIVGVEGDFKRVQFVELFSEPLGESITLFVEDFGGDFGQARAFMSAAAGSNFFSAVGIDEFGNFVADAGTEVFVECESDGVQHGPAPFGPAINAFSVDPPSLDDAGFVSACWSLGADAESCVLYTEEVGGGGAGSATALSPFDGCTEMEIAASTDFHLECAGACVDPDGCHPYSYVALARSPVVRVVVGAGIGRFDVPRSVREPGTYFFTWDAFAVPACTLRDEGAGADIAVDAGASGGADVTLTANTELSLTCGAFVERRAVAVGPQVLSVSAAFADESSFTYAYEAVEVDSCTLSVALAASGDVVDGDGPLPPSYASTFAYDAGNGDGVLRVTCVTPFGELVEGSATFAVPAP